MNSKALQCDSCDKWVHIGCIPLSEDTYHDLGNTSNLWLCSNCGLPNSSDLINTLNIPVSNSFSILNDNVSLDDYTDLDSTIKSDTQLLEPQGYSTPERKQPRNAKAKHSLKPLKMVNINCRSETKNRDRLGVLIDTLKPDIIIGTELFLIPGDPDPS